MARGHRSRSASGTSRAAASVDHAQALRTRLGEFERLICDELDAFIIAARPDPLMSVPGQAVPGGRRGDVTHDASDLFALALIAHRASDNGTAADCLNAAIAHQQAHHDLLSSHADRPRARPAVPLWRPFGLTSAQPEGIAALIERTRAELDLMHDFAAHLAADDPGAELPEELARRIDAATETITGYRRRRIGAAVEHLHGALADGYRERVLGMWEAVTGATRAADADPVTDAEWEALETITGAERELAAEERMLDVPEAMRALVQFSDPNVGWRHLRHQRTVLAGASTRHAGHPPLPVAEESAQIIGHLHAMLREPQRWNAGHEYVYRTPDPRIPARVAVPASASALREYAQTQAHTPGFQGVELVAVPAGARGGANDLYVVVSSGYRARIPGHTDTQEVTLSAYHALGRTRRTKPEALSAELRDGARAAGFDDTAPVRLEGALAPGITRSGTGRAPLRHPATHAHEILGDGACDHAEATWSRVQLRAREGGILVFGASATCPCCLREGLGVVPWHRMSDADRQRLSVPSWGGPAGAEAERDPVAELRLARYRARLLDEPLPDAAGFATQPEMPLDARAWAYRPEAERATPLSPSLRERMFARR